MAGLLRREPRMGLWSMATTPGLGETEPWMSELLPEPATPVTATSTPSGMSTSTFLRLLALARRISNHPAGGRASGFREARRSRLRPVSVPLWRKPSTGPS